MSWFTETRLAALAALAAAVLLLDAFGPILTPFVVSAGLAYLGDPLVDWLQRRRLSRTGAVVLVFVAISLLVLPALIVLLPMLVDQLRVLIGNIPDYLDWIQRVGLPGIGIHLPPELALDPAHLKENLAENLPQAGGLAREVLGTLSRSGGAFLAFLANALLVPVVSFYLLRDWDDLVLAVDGLVPQRHREAVRGFAREADTVLAGFLRGQLLVMAALSTVYCIGLSMVGLKLALLIGLGAGLVSFVPYLGFIAGILAASIAVLVQTQDPSMLLWVGLVFLVGQMLESMILTPWLVGDRIGLHPVAVVFAVMAGGHLFGFAGVLLGLPVAAVLAVGVRHAVTRWQRSDYFLTP